MEELLGPDAVVKALNLALDSGATMHMVRDPRFLCKLRGLPSPIPIEVADGNLLFATAIGDIETQDIVLPDVHLVPRLKINLASVRQLAFSDILTTFGKNSAELFKDGERVGGAVADGDLYRLRFLRAIGDAAPALAPPREHITSYAASAASSYMKLKEALATSFKNHAVPVDLVPSFEDPAVPVNWMERFNEEILFRGDWFAATAEMDENDKTGGSFVPGKAYLGSDGMHEADFIKVQLNEHCLNA